MSKLAVDYLFKNTPTTSLYPTAYNQDAVGLGDWISRYTGALPQDNYCAPQSGIFRPYESISGGVATLYPHIVKWSSDIYHVFLADGTTTAGTTRKIIMATYTKSTGAFAYKGAVTLTLGVSAAHVIRGHRMVLDRYTTGTVAVAATAVTGTNTLWLTNRFAVGSRIGFGSTDPTAITTWYQVTAMASDTGITIGTSAGTIAAGTPYVLEEYTHLLSSAVAAQGGFYMTRGLNADIFLPTAAGTTVALAVATDLQRAVYWLKDNATQTNLASAGLCIEDKISSTVQYAYLIDAATVTTPKVFKYNFRAPLTVASGNSVSAWVLTTGVQTVTGNTSLTNNGRIGSLAHGPGTGVPSLYFATTTRIYRAALTNITSGNVTWLSDSMTEVPPGSINTMAASGAMSSLEIISAIDRLVVFTGTTQRSYVTQYRTDGGQMDHSIFVTDNQLDQAALDGNFTPHINIGATTISGWAEDGLLLLCRNGTAATTNIVYALAAHADYTYASIGKTYLVSPRIATPNAKKLAYLYVSCAQYVGGDKAGVPPEPIKLYVRTAGISDDSGAWNLVPADGDISGISPGAYIQVAVSFRTFGYMCVPARVLGLGITYEDTASLSNYQFSATLSDATNKRFAWRFATAFGSTVPALQIQLYDAQTGGLLLTDNTTAPTGTWEKSTNSGGAWSAYNTTDLSGTTTYIRYTPASLADSIVVRPVLTLA